MEIVAILVFIAVVSVAVYFQLKGSRPDVVPVQHLTTTTKKSPKKASVEPKKVTEQWDKEDKKVERSDSPTGKKKKQRFDPVAQGKKVLQSETMRKRERAVKYEEEKTEEEIVAERRNRKQMLAQGFTVIDEKPRVKKAVAPAEEAVAAPVEVKEEKKLSPFEERIQKLKAVVSRKPGTELERPDDERKPYGDRPKKSAIERMNEPAEYKKDHIEAMVREMRGNNTGSRPKTEATKPKAIVMAKSAGAGVSRGWEKPIERKPAPVAEEVEEEAAPEPVEEPVAEAPVDDFTDAPVEEF